jgi:hypothetical protein
VQIYPVQVTDEVHMDGAGIQRFFETLVKAVDVRPVKPVLLQG